MHLCWRCRWWWSGLPFHRSFDRHEHRRNGRLVDIFTLTYLGTMTKVFALFAACLCMAGVVLAAPALPTTEVLDDKSYLDVFIGNLENELKAELKELRETPEKPFVQPYVIDNAPAFDENLTKTTELLTIATLHYKAQDNIVVALENALKKAKKSRAKHDLRYEKAVETIKSSKFQIAKLEQEMKAILESQGKHKEEMEAVYNASKDIAEREYLANVQEAQFDLEDRTTKEKIDYGKQKRNGLQSLRLDQNKK